MKKKNEKAEERNEEVLETKISLIAQEFGNGDMNVLRDKINELIALIA